MRAKTGSSTKLIVLITLFLSLIFGLPHLIIPAFLGGWENYHPLTVNNVPISTLEETYVYGAQAKDVCEGHLLSVDAHLVEHKDLPISFSPLSSLFAGSLGCLLGSIPRFFLIADFILPPIIFLALFFFLRKITSSTTTSLLGAALVLTADRLFLFLPPLTLGMAQAFWDILSINGRETIFLEFSRYPYPQLAFLILILQIYGLFRALVEKSFRWVLLAAIFLGLLFYTYFYYWIFVLAGIVFLLPLLLWQKKSDEVKILLLTTFVGLVISLPHWIFFFNFQAIPARQDILERMGLEPGRIRNLYRTAQYLIFAFIVFRSIKKKDFTFWFLLAFLLGGIAALNIQLLTGYTLQSWHWVTVVLNPFSIIILVYLLSRIFNRKSIPKGFKRFYTPIVYFLIIFFILRAFALQFVAAKNTYQGYTLPQTTIEAFNWLNNNTLKDAVILTPSFETNSQIPVYTHNNIFLPAGNVTVASNQEITERLLTAYQIFGIGREQLAKTLAYRGDGMGDCQGDTCLVKFEFWEKQAIIELFYYKYLRKNESLSSWSTFYEMPKSEQQQILSAYDRLLENPGLFPTRFKLDYLYYGPAERKIKETNFNQYPWAKEVYRNQDVIIYEVGQNVSQKN